MKEKTGSRWLGPVVIWLGLAGALVALWLSGQGALAWEIVREARPLPLLIVVAIGTLLPVIHALRWRIVMRALGTEIPLITATDITVSSAFANYASPGYMGAPAKVLLANRLAGAPWRQTLLAMAFEQGLDFLVLLALSTVALLVLGPDRLVELLPDVDRPVQAAIVAGAVIVVVLTLVVGRERVGRAAGRIIDAFRTLGAEVDRGAVATLTLTHWLEQAAVVAALLWALRLPADPTTVFALATIPLLIGQVVPLPGGVGAREAAIVALAGATGAGTAGLLGLAILQRVLLTVALPFSLGTLRALRLLGVAGAPRANGAGDAT
jgi:uncharacterized membrane protein YbhN (UPF0104 family)